MPSHEADLPYQGAKLTKKSRNAKLYITATLTVERHFVIFRHFKGFLFFIIKTKEVILRYDKSTKNKDMRLDIGNSITDCPCLKHTVGSDIK